jgi:hypothetical protein
MSNNFYFELNTWFHVLLCVDCIFASLRIAQVDPGR